MTADNAGLAARARRIRLAVFDVDGVLTDGRLLFLPDGQEVKMFNALDGHGLKMLAASGVQLAILSGRESPAVTHRAAGLGFHHVRQNVSDKQAALAALLDATGVAAADTSFMGDDLIDLPAMARVGLAVSVPGAVAEVRQRAHYVTTRGGGDGAVREFCELVMRAQNTWARQLSRYID